MSRQTYGKKEREEDRRMYGWTEKQSSILTETETQTKIQTADRQTDRYFNEGTKGQKD